MMKVHSSKPYASFPHFFLSNKECDDKYCKCDALQMSYYSKWAMSCQYFKKINGIRWGDRVSYVLHYFTLLAGKVASMSAHSCLTEFWKWNKITC